MPFVGFDKAKLMEKFPTTVGRAGKPSVAIAGNGRIQFSVSVSEAFQNCKVLSPSFDGDSNRLRLQGLAETPKGKESTTWEIGRPKESKNKTCSISGALLLKAIEYDYKAAGNQTYEVEKQDNDKHVVIFALPKETPKMKPSRPRKTKAEKNGDGKVTTPTPASAASKAAMGAKTTPQDDDEVVVVEE